MNKYDLVKNIEVLAPLDTQESWDASGWIIDSENPEVNKILFALTPTDDIFEQALRNQCDLIITHHPLFFVPFKYRNINLYCAHTNLDKALGGTTDLLIDAVKMVGKRFNDFVRIVELENEMSVEFLKLKLLPISPRLRVVNNKRLRTIKTIAFCAGSGSEFIDEVPCDAFVTGDLKYHTAVESKKVIFDIGHFESEIFVVEFLRKLVDMEEKGIIANEESPFI